MAACALSWSSPGLCPGAELLTLSCEQQVLILVGAATRSFNRKVQLPSASPLGSPPDEPVKSK